MFPEDKGLFPPPPGLQIEEGRCGEREADDARHLRAVQQAEDWRCVVAAEEFEEEPRRAVEHDVEREALPARVSRRAVEQEQREDGRIELSLPDFRRPERLVAVCMIGERCCRIEDAERAVRRRAECIAIEEVRTAAERLAEDDGRREDIHEMQRVEPVAAAIPDAREYAEQDAALDGHAALPDAQKLREMVVVIRPIEKEDIPEAGTDEPRDAAVDAEVYDVFLLAAAVGFREKIADACREDDGKGKHEPVGADGEVPEEEEILVHNKRPFWQNSFSLYINWRCGT